MQEADQRTPARESHCHLQLNFFFPYFRFNVIIAFATNYLLQQGVHNATTVARYGVSDAQAYLKATSQQSNHILVKNYDELAVHLELMLQGRLNLSQLRQLNFSHGFRMPDGIAIVSQTLQHPL